MQTSVRKARDHRVPRDQVSHRHFVEHFGCNVNVSDRRVTTNETGGDDVVGVKTGPDNRTVNLPTFRNRPDFLARLQGETESVDVGACGEEEHSVVEEEGRERSGRYGEAAEEVVPRHRRWI